MPAPEAGILPESLSVSAPASIHRCSCERMQMEMCKIIRTKTAASGIAEKSQRNGICILPDEKRDHTGDEKSKDQTRFNNSRVFCILPAAASLATHRDRASSIPAQDREIPSA